MTSLLERHALLFQDLIMCFRVSLAFPSSHPPSERFKAPAEVGTVSGVKTQTCAFGPSGSSAFTKSSLLTLSLSCPPVHQHTRLFQVEERTSQLETYSAPGDSHPYYCLNMGTRRAGSSVYLVFPCLLNSVTKTFEFKDDSRK